jgi:hypothetical protein
MTWLERWSRLATIPAGYALTSLISAAMVRIVPVSRVEAVSIGFVSFFAIYATLILWAYGTRRIERLWIVWAFAGALLASYLYLSSATVAQ